MITLEAEGAYLSSNSDFSGDASIVYIDDSAQRRSVTLPGAVFLALAKRAVGRQMFYAVESAIDDWIGSSESPGPSEASR